MKIINVYTQKVPATRFIGKKYGDEDRVNGFFGQKWGDAFEHGLFGIIEKNAGTETFFTDSNSCIGLMRVKDGEPFEYWIGKFTPESTEVPNELQYREPLKILMLTNPRNLFRHILQNFFA